MRIGKCTCCGKELSDEDCRVFAWSKVCESCYKELTDDGYEAHQSIF